MQGTPRRGRRNRVACPNPSTPDARQIGQGDEVCEKAGYGLVEHGGGERSLFVAEAVDDPGGREEGEEVAFSRARTKHGRHAVRDPSHQ